MTRVNGGGGDDTLVWTNGDGNDVMNGDAGFDVIENDLGNADDESTLKMENGRVRYDRINGAFNLSIGSAELMQLNTFGGNDTLRAALDVTLNLDVNGGSGNDSLDGARRQRPHRRRRRRRPDRHPRGQGRLHHRRRRQRPRAGRAARRGRGRRRERRERRRPPGPTPASGRGAATLAKTAKVAKGVAIDQGLLPGRHRGLQGLDRAVLDQDHQGGQAEGQARARPHVLQRRRGPEQDDQGQARLGHGQAGQEEEAGRHGPRRREVVEADALVLECFHVAHEGSRSSWPGVSRVRPRGR